MIQGQVVGLQARLDVSFRLSGQPDLLLECVVDTGFEGAFTLPPAAIAALRLPYLTQLNANLADWSNVPTDVYVATVVWDGTEREVAVLALGSRPLVGTALLDGHRLGVESLAFIHPSAWSRDSRKVAKKVPKLVHLGNALTPVEEYDVFVTRPRGRRATEWDRFLPSF